MAPDEKMLPEVTVLSETSQSTVEFPMAQLDPKRKVPRRSTIGWFRALCGPPVDPMDGRFERGAIVSNHFFQIPAGFVLESQAGSTT